MVSKTTKECNYGWDLGTPWERNGLLRNTILQTPYNFIGWVCWGGRLTTALPKGEKNSAVKLEGWELRKGACEWRQDSLRIGRTLRSRCIGCSQHLCNMLTERLSSLFWVPPVMRRHSFPEQPVPFLKSLSAEYHPICLISIPPWPENVVVEREYHKNPCTKKCLINAGIIEASPCLD